MSKPFLMLVWATGDEERPLECDVFDHFVDRPLREDDQANEIAAVLGDAIYKHEAKLIIALNPASGRRLLLISLDALKVRGDEAVLYSKDLQEVVVDVQAPVWAQPTEPVLEFESRANEVARGCLVPATRMPSPVTRFVKEFKNCINADVRLEAEKHLRDAMADKFPQLPDVERAALFERLFADLPEDFESRAAALAEINEAFRQELAARLTPALNAHLKDTNPGDADAKKQLASDVMERLDGMGLAVRSPDDGAASTLNVWIDGRHPLGRFAIQPKGKRPAITRANITDLLPLELTDARPRREALKEWRQSRADEPKK